MSFARAETFGHALKEAFEFFMNARQTKPAELVAKWMDARLKAGGGKGLTEEELESKLDAALALFRCVHVHVCVCARVCVCTCVWDRAEAKGCLRLRHMRAC